MDVVLNLKHLFVICLCLLAIQNLHTVSQNVYSPVKKQYNQSSQREYREDKEDNEEVTPSVKAFDSSVNRGLLQKSLLSCIVPQLKAKTGKLQVELKKQVHKIERIQQNFPTYRKDTFNSKIKRI